MLGNHSKNSWDFEILLLVIILFAQVLLVTAQYAFLRPNTSVDKQAHMIEVKMRAPITHNV